MIQFMKSWINNHRGFVNYFLISCLVTVLDIVTSFVTEKGLVMISMDSTKASLTGNAVGIIVGFAVQYFLCTKKVYAGSNMKTLIIFFLTWALGFIFAELLIYLVRTVIFHDAEGIIYFLTAKFFSVVVPFFLTYFLRKILLPAKKSNSKE